MNVLGGGAYQRFSADGIQKMVKSLENIDNNTGPNGAIVGSIQDLTRAVLKQSKHTLNAGISVKDAIALKILGKSGLQGIGQGIKFIVSSIEEIKDPKSFADKLKAITDGLDKFTGIGRSILGFATMFAAATPLLILSAAAMPITITTLTLLGIGLGIAGKMMTKATMSAMKDLALVGLSILGFGLAMYIAKPLYEAEVLPTVGMVSITLLGLAGVFWLMDKMNFTVNAIKIGLGIGAASLGIMTLGAALGVFRLAIPPNGDGWHTIAQAGAAILLVGVLAAVAGIPGVDVVVGSGGLMLAMAGLGLMSIAAGLGVFRLAISPDAEGWHTIGQAGAAVLGIGLAFAGVGLVSPFVALGAIATGLAGLALLPITAGIFLMGAISKNDGVAWLFQQSGYNSTFFNKPMSNLEYMIDSLAWAFAINPGTIILATAGAVAVGNIGLALISVGKGIKAFQGIDIDYEAFPIQVDSLISTIIKPFEKIGLKGGVSSTGSLLKLITGIGFDTFLPKNPVESGIAFVMGIGKAMSSVAIGVAEMSRLRYATYNPDGSVKSYVSIGQDAWGTFAKNMVMLTDAVIKPFETIGNKYKVNEKSWAAVVFGSNFDGTHTLSPVEGGIAMIKGISYAVSEIYKSISSLGEFKIPVYDRNGKITSYLTMTGGQGLFRTIGANFNEMITAMTTPFANLGKQYPINTQSWVGVVFGTNFNGTHSLNPVESGIAMVKGIGIAVAEVLKGVELYVKNRLERFDGDAFAKNMQKMIKGLVSPLAEIGADTSPAWLKIFSNDALDKGLGILEDLTPNINNLIKNAVAIQRIKFDGKTIEGNLTTIITSLTRPFILLERSLEKQNLHTPLTSLRLSRNFESIAKSMETISRNLTQWDKTVNIFQRYEKTQKSITEHINRTNYKKLELIDSTFKSLVFLTKGGDNAIQVLGDKLIDALDGFAGIIDEFVMSIAEISAENGGLSPDTSSYYGDAANEQNNITNSTRVSTNIDNSNLVAEVKALGVKLDNIKNVLSRQ